MSTAVRNINSSSAGPVITYHGLFRSWGPHQVIRRDQHGRYAGELHHIPRHSRIGFEWGWGAGSGTSDLARAMLLDTLGYDGVTQDIRAVTYRAFAAEHLTRVGAAWEISRADILDWYRRHTEALDAAASTRRSQVAG